MTDDQVEETPAAPAGGGIFSLIIPPVIAGVAAFGGTFLLSGGLDGGEKSADAETPETELASGDAGKADKNKSDKKKKKKKKGEDIAADGYIMQMEPIIVSLADEKRAGHRAPRLRVIVAIEGTDKDYSEDTKMQVKLRDGFTGTIRSLSAKEIGAPGGLELLRTALHAEALELFGPDHGISVLITDFLIT